MAATGTPTPNIGLRIPQGTDPASVDDINYNSNLLDTKLGAVGNDSVQDQINALNSKINLIGTEYVSNGTITGAVAGTREITCPAGTYLLTFGGQTQSKNTACNMNVNGGTAWQRFYLGIVTPDNSSSNMCSAYKTERIVLSATTTLTLNYTAGWYYTEILAIRIQ